MQPLLITSLVALLIALIKIRSLQQDLDMSQHLVDFWTTATNDWSKRGSLWREKYDAQVNLVNKLQVDNALLKAELKKKHRRVPQL